MWVQQLRIESFRGIKSAVVNFGERQTILVGPNGAGKSTLLEAFALLFGRDRLVRTLTEHDFYGSDPQAGDRIRFVATITGFSSNTTTDHSQWFSERRGVPKWIGACGALLAEPQTAEDALAVQIGFCARFDRRMRSWTRSMRTLTRFCRPVSLLRSASFLFRHTEPGIGSYLSIPTSGHA